MAELTLDHIAYLKQRLARFRNEFSADLQAALDELVNARTQKNAAAKPELVQELSEIIHDMVVGQQAAYIEWKHGKGAKAGMGWIASGLFGPGQIPDADAPYGKEPQAYFDANKSRPFPLCPCGRPSNILWMGKGFCSDAHFREAKAEHAQ